MEFTPNSPGLTDLADLPEKVTIYAQTLYYQHSTPPPLRPRCRSVYWAISVHHFEPKDYIFWLGKQSLGVCLTYYVSQPASLLTNQ